MSDDGLRLLIGTRKGLFFMEPKGGDRTAWSVSEPHFLGHVINHAILDPRDRQSLLVATATGHLGPTIMRSSDMGATWSEATKPPAFPAGDRLSRSLSRVFWLSPGHADEPGSWYAGGTPQGLFRSADGGDTWEPVTGWNDHAMWETWAEWPDQGTPDGSMLHSVHHRSPRSGPPIHQPLGRRNLRVDRRRRRLAAAERWRARRLLPRPLSGVRTGPAHDADPSAAAGPSLPAEPLRHLPPRPPGTKWERIGDNMPREVGDIGFPVELHPRDPDTVWVFPMDGTDVWPRTSPDGKPSAYVTRDAGLSWQRCDAGLPERAWYTVKRQAMTTDDGDPGRRLLRDDERRGVGERR